MGQDGQSSSAKSLVVVAGVQPMRIEHEGERLFTELGCVECHATGIGPALEDRLGEPVAEAGCGAVIVDNDFIRESILDPTAVVAAGFPPIMPSFAGKVSDRDLAALVAYIASLRSPTNVSH
jgi:cytochrome c oxidase subunit 2